MKEGSQTREDGRRETRSDVINDLVNIVLQQY